MSTLPPYRADPERRGQVDDAVEAFTSDGTYGCKRVACVGICMILEGRDLGHVWLDVKGNWHTGKITDATHRAAMDDILGAL